VTGLAQQASNGWGMMPAMDAAEEIFRIESTRAPEDADAACMLRWQRREWVATVSDVRQTAEELFTCAAYADLIGQLLQDGFTGDVVAGLTREMLRKRQPQYFGMPNTMFMLPAGSSVRKQGLVLISRRNLFHKGKADGELAADEARAMARAWLTTAEAAEADTLFGRVLHRSGWMTEPELDALFGLLLDIRGGEAEMPPRRESA